jgi:hypothetical protein
MDRDNATTLNWLDESLRWANGEGRLKLVGLLSSVRDDVFFELETMNVANFPLRRPRSEIRPDKGKKNAASVRE